MDTNIELSNLAKNEIKITEKPKKKTLKDYYESTKIARYIPYKSCIIIVPIVIIALSLLVYMNISTKSDTANTNLTGTIDSTSKYVNELESKLKNVLCNINGAGSTEVMITVESATELVVAMSSDERTTTTTSGNNSTTSVVVVEEPIIISNNGSDSALVLYEKLPEIKGVVVVSTGASDTKVKLQLLQAVQTVLGVSSDKVEIFAGNKN